MINTKEQEPFSSQIEKEEKDINIRDVISNYFFHWPVFAFGIFISLTIAYLYLRYTQPLYEISSTLLIKDEKKGGSLSSKDLLDQLDLFGGSKDVDNEIEILRSKTLMRDVVNRLSLAITYEASGRVINSDIYSNRPIEINIVQLDSAFYGHILDISFPNSNSYVINDNQTGKKVIGNFDQVQRNFLGVYVVKKSSFFESLRKDKLKLLVQDPDNVVNEYLRNLTVAVTNKQSTALRLQFQTNVPKKGEDVLNTLIQVYNEAALKDKNRTTQSTINFIDERLKLISGELTEVEKNVEVFKSSRGLTDITSDAALFLDNVKANDTKLGEVELQLSVIKNIQKYVNSSSSQEKLPSTLGIDDPTLLGQISQLGDLQLKRDQLLATTQLNNPLVEPLAKQIETTRAGIKANIQNIASSLEATKSELNGNNSKFQGSIKKIPGQERQFISIKRQQTIKETLYLYLLQKKEEAALSYASTVADSRIVDPAYATKSPIKPKRPLTYLFAIVAGFILPIAYLYIKDLMNNKVESRSDLTKLTKVPVLGDVMYDEGSGAIVVEANSRKAIAEQFRAIRTNLQFVQGKRELGRGGVTLITSSMSGEGKSFVSSNIAAALAISGKKTVLLELDLRKPKVSKYLALGNKTGLSNYLIGKAEIKDIIQISGVNNNLHVIGSGPVPPNPSELLLQKDIDILIDHLKNNFDEIIIDTPPIGLVTDALILSRLADSSIYIVRQDVTFKGQISELDNLYQNKKFPKLNIILNGVKFGGRYGYGYGYGYGYYSDDNKAKKVSVRTIIKNILNRF